MPNVLQNKLAWIGDVWHPDYKEKKSFSLLFSSIFHTPQLPTRKILLFLTNYRKGTKAKTVENSKKHFFIIIINMLTA